MLSSPIYIVCTIDNNYAQHCGVMLYSLFDTNPNEKFEIYILTEHISTKNTGRLEHIAQQFGQSLKIIDIRFDNPDAFIVDGHISLATYYRLKMADYLPGDIDKVLFLDADIIIHGSIQPLWSTDLKNYSHAASEDVGHSEPINRLGLPKNSVYFNAGVMLINLKKWRDEAVGQKVLSYIDKNKNKIIWWDQDALNAVLHNDYVLLHNKWNFLYNFFLFDEQILGISKEVLEELRDNPSIIHYNTKHKPWHIEDRHPYKERYIHYLKKTPWRCYSYSLDWLKRKQKRLENKIKRLLKVKNEK